MKEFKGTGAPWTIKRTRKGHFLVSGDGWYDFAKIYTITEKGHATYDCTKAETAANAHLIAAAPDLLEALQECKAALDVAYMGEKTLQSIKAEKAIKKALGK